MNLVRESLITEKKGLELSAGLVIIQKGTILLGHPTGQKWYGTYSFPKGHVEPGEDLLDAAIRETKEEIGLSINPEDVVFPEPDYIDYLDKDKKLYKRVYYFIVNPSEPIYQNSIIPDKKEIDWAGFLTKEKAEVRIFWRLKEVLKHVEDVKKIEDFEEEMGDNESI
jgi:ADP-ribose pyrophosphatase YjhB (NUDIX family)